MRKKNLSVLVFFITLLFMSSHIWAGSTGERLKEYRFDSYLAAEQSYQHNKNYLFFTMNSVRFFFFRNSFDGHVKNFIVSGEIIGKKDQKIPQEILGLQVGFDVLQIDTDLGARDERMWEICFDAKNNPRVVVKITEPVLIGVDDKNYQAQMIVRGRASTVIVKIEKITILEHEQEILIKGQAVVNLSALKIPNPSMAVARIDENVLIHFQAIL